MSGPFHAIRPAVESEVQEWSERSEQSSVESHLFYGVRPALESEWNERSERSEWRSIVSQSLSMQPGLRWSLKYKSGGSKASEALY